MRSISMSYPIPHSPHHSLTHSLTLRISPHPLSSMLEHLFKVLIIIICFRKQIAAFINQSRKEPQVKIKFKKLILETF